MSESRARPDAVAGAVPVLRALRPHQWIKNTLVFVPLLLAYEYADVDRLLATLLGFVAFCGCASATYLVNDLVDADADRLHPRKRSRPIAAGTLARSTAVVLSALLLGASFALSVLLLSPLFTIMLLGYVALTTIYSFWLKERIVIDVLLLAGLYTHRVLSGAVAAEVTPSPWLLVFAVFFFLSLALLKRYVELRGAGAGAGGRRGYEVDDLPLIESMGLTSGFLGVLVIGLYVSGPDVQRLYRTPALLWGICPVLLFWCARIWLLARRGLVDDDPVLFAVRDRSSWIAALLIAGVAATAHAIDLRAILVLGGWR